MKRGLLIWGVLAVIALCFVGCCYYNNHHCCPENDCSEVCPDSDCGGVETVSIEAVELAPVTTDAAKDSSAAPAPKTTDAHPDKK